MKSNLAKIAAVIVMLSQSSCFTMMAGIGSATSGKKLYVHDRVIAGALDVATAPLQIPIWVDVLTEGSVSDGEDKFSNGPHSIKGP